MALQIPRRYRRWIVAGVAGLVIVPAAAAAAKNGSDDPPAQVAADDSSSRSDASAGSTPDSANDTTPVSTDDSTPDSTPNTTDDSTPDSVPNTTPDSTPNTTPDSVPDPVAPIRPFTRTYDMVGGSATVTWDGIRLSIDALSVAPGFDIDERREERDKVELRLRSDDQDRVLEVRTDEGRLRERVENN